MTEFHAMIIFIFTFIGVMTTILSVAWLVSNWAHNYERR
jgi:hypothetical protein